MPIFDQGYQHWKGPLSGHAWRWLAVTRRGIRGQLKGRLVRTLLLVAWVPALVLVTVLACWGLFEQGAESVVPLIKPMLPPTVAADPKAYRSAIWTIAYATFFKFEIFFIMMLVLMVGQNLVSGDLRFNALPLYLSRPLTRLDYFLGKLGVIATLVAAVAVAPAAAAYLLGVGFSLDVSVVRDTWRLLAASTVYGLVIVASAGSLMLALSSMSRRTLYVGMAWIGLWIISAAVAGVLGGIRQATLRETAWQEENNRPADEQPPPPQQRSGHHRGGGAWARIHERVQELDAETARTNWRPICSYTANLHRLGDALLDTDAAWVQIGRAVAAPRAMIGPMFGRPSGGPGGSESLNERTLADRMVPQYPWTWSAGVLAGLLGLSLWILSMRIKSLDRLR